MSRDETTLKKHSIVIAGHQTSITLEGIFWQQLKILARQQDISLSTIVAEIDAERQVNLSSAIRVYILKNALKD
ncbi:MAG: ribbon-helix-helix domain-containing protein [Emcibacter sp.]|nr:ribbon-helix-helix domain-containing protein [Emcibacter sp.]MBL4894569.1 ribbon-helix-helix domain-containing protein [Emcibacter sp.]